MMYSRLPMTRTFKRNRKKFEFSGARRKLAGRKEKKQFLLHSEHFNLSLGLIYMDVGDPR